MFLLSAWSLVLLVNSSNAFAVEYHELKDVKIGSTIEVVRDGLLLTNYFTGEYEPLPVGTKAFVKDIRYDAGNGLSEGALIMKVFIHGSDLQVGEIVAGVASNPFLKIILEDESRAFVKLTETQGDSELTACTCVYSYSFALGGGAATQQVTCSDGSTKSSKNTWSKDTFFKKGFILLSEFHQNFKDVLGGQTVSIYIHKSLSKVECIGEN